MAVISNGTTIADAGSFSVGLGSLTLIKTITITSGTSTVAFSHGSSSVVFDSTYPNYLFTYASVHGSAEQEIVIDFSDSAGSDYDLLHQSTFFRAAHNEGDTDANLAYVTSRDMALSGSRPFLTVPVGTGADESGSGHLYVFNPSNTTYVTHFFSICQNSNHSDTSALEMMGGYCNVTAAIDAVQFSVSGGNFASGTINLYGIR